MIIETGHFALILAFCVACVQTIVPLYGAWRGDKICMSLDAPAAKLQFILLLWAFVALSIAFVTSDFSVMLVANNSHAAKPLMYKIAGVWGNHEGSMLLWIVILAAYGAAVAQMNSETSNGADDEAGDEAGGRMPAVLRARALAVQGFLGVCFIGFSLFTSNPFTRLNPAPFSGSGLNPILQDPALAAHPPLLYLGYVGFSLAFSFTIAALLGGVKLRYWLRFVRVWILLAWAMLTAGVALGSYWAYYELGWGGFWFWDPVENASLMPLLASTALLHCVFAAQKQSRLHHWTLLLCILTFGLSIAGTFLVRSGVLTSVHAFANDPDRGIFVLAILAITIGGALVLYALKSGAMIDDAKGRLHLLSREGTLLVNNIFLASATATIFVGTLYPLAIDALNMGKISVGAPYYNIVFTPLMVPIIVLMPLGPFLGWGAGRKAGWWRQLQSAAILSILFVATILLMRGGLRPSDNYQTGAVLGLAGAGWLIFGAGADMVRKMRRRGTMFLPVRGWGSVLGHAGVGIVLFGIIGTTAWKEEKITLMQAGDITKLGGYTLRFERVEDINGANYHATRGVFQVQWGHKAHRLTPERRFYEVERSQTTEAAILKRLVGHVYIALGEKMADSNQYIVRIWVHPFVMFIWLGAGVIFCGGLASFIGRWKDAQ